MILLELLLDELFILLVDIAAFEIDTEKDSSKVAVIEDAMGKMEVCCELLQCILQTLGAFVKFLGKVVEPDAGIFRV